MNPLSLEINRYQFFHQIRRKVIHKQRLQIQQPLVRVSSLIALKVGVFGLGVWAITRRQP
jgi:hypothetical protein